MNMESNEKPIINRIKVVLVEQKRTNKWLADTLGKDCTTVSKWCTNTAQPGLETLVKIAECLDVDARELIVPTKKEVWIADMPEHMIHLNGDKFLGPR